MTGLRILVYGKFRFGQLWDVFRALDSSVWLALAVTMAGVCCVYWLFDAWYTAIDRTDRRRKAKKRKKSGGAEGSGPGSGSC